MAIDNDFMVDGSDMGANRVGRIKNEGRSASFRAMGASIRSQMTDEEKEIEGSMQDKVAFVCALGNPKKKQPRHENGKDYPSYEVVGYKLKFLADMKVPRINLKHNPESVIDVEDTCTWEDVKAGELKSFNLMEIGVLITQEQFAGKFTGEGVTVYLLGKSSNGRTDILPVLKKEGNGSVKKDMELVADVIGGEGSRGVPKVKPEFEDKFAVLFDKYEMKQNRGIKKQTGTAAADLAAAFRQQYSKKFNH